MLETGSADWPQDLAVYATTATNGGSPFAARKDAVRALSLGANDANLPHETRNRALIALATIAGNQAESQRLREEAFGGLLPGIHDCAAVVAKSYPGQASRDLVVEAASIIWDKLPQFRPGPWTRWCRTVLWRNRIDKVRRQQAQPSQLDLPKYEPAIKDPNGESWTAITERIAAQTDTIQQVLPAKEQGVPYGPVLLMSERVWLARTIAACFEPEDGRTIGDDTVRGIVELLTDWRGEHEDRALPPRNTTLVQAWVGICERTDDQPHTASKDLLAAVLGLARGRWEQWVHRGRLRLARRFGASNARQLFPHWPAAIFECGGGTLG